MTYGELNQIKTTGFTTNHIIDDEVNNARFCYGRKSWDKQIVPEFVINKINEWATKEGVAL